MTRPLGSEYVTEVDSFDTRTWYNTVADFHDASLYQVWEDGNARRGPAAVSRLLLKSRDEVVAGAEVRLFQVPLSNRGIAYVRWGPLWRREAGDGDPAIFREAIHALCAEYVTRRGMILRILPRLYVEEDGRCLSVLKNLGFSRLEHVKPSRSLLRDLSEDLTELRKGFAQKWRNCLNKAERLGMTVACGTTVELFDEFTVLYYELLRRKGFTETADIHKHRHLQRVLPEPLKMEVVIARFEGQPCAGAVFSAIGDTAVYLFGATNESGMRTSASYLVQWEVLRRLKEKGIGVYDLNGIDPDLNPGTYRFKKGLAGKAGREVTFPSQFQIYEPSLLNHSVLSFDRLRHGIREFLP